MWQGTNGLSRGETQWETTHAASFPPVNLSTSEQSSTLFPWLQSLIPLCNIQPFPLKIGK